MAGSEETIISALSGDEIDGHLGDLGELVHASVHAGASIGFILPFSIADSEAFWHQTVQPELGAGGLLLLVAYRQDQVVGSVQLNYNTPANQPHRADVKKLLVHPAFRRQGVAKALMAELERRAKWLGRRLLTLDTRTGDSAEPLYASLGYRTVGIIPGFCLNAIERDQLDSTTIMYKSLRDDMDKEKSSDM
jgi:ribosomal protein S18 acetylase RimI-like enzyme